jgi:hypothetical protein
MVYSKELVLKLMSCALHQYIINTTYFIYNYTVTFTLFPPFNMGGYQETVFSAPLSTFHSTVGKHWKHVRKNKVCMLKAVSLHLILQYAI